MPKLNQSGDIFPLKSNRSLNSKKVIVCFADIRSFTTFVQKDVHSDNRLVDKLLETFYMALNIAIKKAVNGVDQDSDFGKAICDLARPALKKTIGDGIMLVWEYSDTLNDKIVVGLKLLVLDFIQFFQYHYYELKRDMEKTRPDQLELLEPLKIGIGLASGDALKLNRFGSTGKDYISHIVNLASRLQDVARPGLVVQLTYDFNIVLDRFCTHNEGEISAIRLKNIAEPILVWKVGNQNILPRRTRIVSDFYNAQRSIEYNKENKKEHQALKLTEDDTENIFEVRRRFEVQFVTDLYHRFDQLKG